MMLKKKNKTDPKIHFILCCFLLCGTLSFSQIIKGRILESSSQEPISGVSIYIDGTSLGVVTDLDGYFSINYPDNLGAPLVIRMLGYQTLQFKNPFEVDLSSVALVQRADQLDAVVLELDPWSREKKERFFKNYFLGKTTMALECKILNLDKVRLRFNPVTGLMTATSNESILIENKYLGYLIRYDLHDFELIFSKTNIDTITHMTNITVSHATQKDFFKAKESFYSGSSFFQELTSKTGSSRKYRKRREKLYEGSILHFFKALGTNRLKENGYQLAHKGFMVSVDDHIRVKQLAHFSSVGFRNEKYTILDSNNKQTDISLNGDQIMINSYGNNLSNKAIKFTGYLAKLRVAGMLPLDYNPKKD